MNQPLFTKSIRLLGHPLSLAALALMLANDFLFKALWPSWWTGKLSDFAGLFFLPFLLAAGLGLGLPARWGRRAGGLAFGLSGLGFALLKLSPPINAALLDGFRALTGLALQARPDPSDLLALLSLLPAAWLWRGAELPRPAPAPGWRLLVLPLAALVCLADAAAPDLGVACLQAEGGQILATTRVVARTFRSLDGGLSWQSQAGDQPAACPPQGQDFSATLQLQDPASGDLYRFNPRENIERSPDGGQTWQVDFSFSPNEAERAYRKLAAGASLSWGSQPAAVLLDPGSGNLILAMGQDGVLVRRAGAGWSWVDVGGYQHDSLRRAGAGGLLFLLQAHLALSVLAAFGWLYTRAARRLGRYRFWVILGWIALAGAALLLTPEILTDGYLRVASALALVGIGLVLLVVLAVAALKLKGDLPGLLLSALPQMALIFLACLLPYGLWGTRVLADYGPALLISSGAVGLLVVLFGSRVSKA